MAEEESVKVAVRVRPFNGRERDRGATCIVEMKGNTTYLTDPEDKDGEPRKFAYDFSYWSFDGSKKMPDGYYGPDSSHPNGKKFCDQKKVFEDLGVGVMNNAWEGYNTTLFAYGQTGSGKSWSVVGYGINKGIVPLFCDRLFKEIDAKKGPDCTFEVMFSMLEIYMEEVRDLFNPDAGGLRVRQHPKRGFYASGLKTCAVGSYKEIELKMEEGTLNRTVASTKMNATSSRAHTIVGIQFVQKYKNAANEETAKTSIVNLVDLAGSERAENTGATGDRLKEGAAINQSLSALGNVIAALADASEGKNVRVPYRDSVLTKLLMNALGGNSKTIMIAAISPADINHDETLSTLRYADRAKQIKCKAVVNEDPTEKLIRELQEENERLKAMISGGKVELPEGTGEKGIEADPSMSASDKKAAKVELEDEYKALMEENEREMEEMKREYEEKLKRSREEDGGMMEKLDAQHEKMKGFGYITNVNYDPQLTGQIVHFVDLEKEVVGNGKGDKCDITLIGPSIQKKHAIFTRDGDTYCLKAKDQSAPVLVNGMQITEKVELKHHDRLIFGTTQYFVFVHPKQRDGAKDIETLPTHEDMQKEITENSGFDTSKENKTKEELVLQADVTDLLPAVEEANAISGELDKKKMFRMIVVTAEARGELEGRTKLFVRVTDFESRHRWNWTQDDFMNRKYRMQEMFNKFQAGEKWDLPKEEDPFYEDHNKETHIGSVKVWLKSLSYKIEAKEQLEIIDYRGEEVGRLNIEMNPCDPKGKEYTEDDNQFCEPDSLVGEDLHFIAKIKSAVGLRQRYTEAYVKFRFYDGQEDICTAKGKDTMNPEWNFKKQFDFKNVTKELVDYLKNSAVVLHIWAKQKMPKDIEKVDTKEELKKIAKKKGGVGAGDANTAMKSHHVDPNKVKLAIEKSTAEKRAEKQERRLGQIEKFVEISEKNNKKKIPTEKLKELLYAPNKKEAEKCLKWAEENKGGDSDSSSSDSSSDDEKKKAKKDNKKKENDKDDKKKEEKDKKKDDDDQKSSTCVLL